MLNYFELNTEQKHLVLEQAAAHYLLPSQAIEKDIWVTTILRLVFTLPCADKMLFKGGTSLGKVWGVINRFSEDIDLSADRELFGLPNGDLTKKQLKKLRKSSSVFVRDELCAQLRNAIDEIGLSSFCRLFAEPDGTGDGTYPEPRKLMITYDSIVPEMPYLKPVVQLEVGARSLFEPFDRVSVKSMVENIFPNIGLPTQSDILVTTSLPTKTFLEKVFLLHELFSVEGHGMNAERKSRHLYDLYQMMNTDFAEEAIHDEDLWETIRHHREVFTSVHGVNYEPDIRRRLVLVPREDIIDVWKSDYETMAGSMIYGHKPSWDDLIEKISELEQRFKTL